MTHKLISIFASVAAFTLTTGTAQASDFNANLGVLGAHIESHVKGEDDDIFLMPYVELQYGMVSLTPDGLGVTTSITPNSELSAILQSRESSFDSNNKILSNLGKRDDTGELLVNWVQKTDFADIRASVSTDLMDKHGGYEIGLGLSRQVLMLGGTVIPHFSLQYQSEDLVDYYYGVSQAEANHAIESYQGKASFTATASVSHVYNVTGSWYATTTVAYDYLGDGIADSTIVERDGFWTGSIAMFYQF